MGLHMWEVAAATAAAGYDCLQDQWINESPYYRKVMRIGICGSAAALDCAFELYYGDRFIGKFFNKATGYPYAYHFATVSGKSLCRPTEKIRLVCVDAAATNPVNFVLETCEYPRMRRGAAGYTRRW